jgi:hypothetical protein
MRAAILCRERLHRIQAVLRRQGGSETVRQLWRRFRIYEWELKQAAAGGWIEIITHKPLVGRPSPRAVERSNMQVAKLPPWRHMIPSEVSIRHWWFALRTTHETIPRGSHFGPSRLGAHVNSYMASFPNAKSRKGAHASCSRLLNHPDVFAMRQWHYARTNREISTNEAMPRTARAIWKRLHELGSSRTRYAPWCERIHWAQYQNEDLRPAQPCISADTDGSVTTMFSN